MVDNIVIELLNLLSIMPHKDSMTEISACVIISMVPMALRLILHSLPNTTGKYNVDNFTTLKRGNKSSQTHGKDSTFQHTVCTQC